MPSHSHYQPTNQPANQPTNQQSNKQTPLPSTLNPFFNPSGVAVIGASAHPRKLSHGVLRNLASYGFTGAIYPVNPTHSSILDLPCYPDIESVPDPVELAVIILPSATCPQVMEACGRRGLKAAIVISGGFREVGAEGAALEEEMARIAHSHGMRLIGPNCVGTLDAYTGLNTTFIRTMPRPGHIAFISQSGAICGGILEWTAGKGVGFSRFATLGNEADVSEADLIEDLAHDPNTRVIVAYLEAIRDGSRFIQVARQVTPHKPVLVIKAGRTVAGNQAVSSHTGSLAGEMAAYDAAFKQSGVQRVDTLEELFNYALALAYGPWPRGNRVAVVTNAGGPASLAADKLDDRGLVMPPPSPETIEALTSRTHPDAQLGNPVDMLGGAEPADYELAVRVLLEDPSYDAVLPILVPQALVDPTAVAEAIGRASLETDKPVVACFMGDEGIRIPRQRLQEHRIAAYQFPEQAAGALGGMWAYVQARQDLELRVSNLEMGAESSVIEPASASSVREIRKAKVEADALLRAAAASGRAQLGEWAARPVLAAYGISQPPAALARSAGEAVDLAADMGYPVALKVVAPDILHKSDVGGIRLGLADGNGVARAYEEMLQQVGKHRPQAEIEGALVSQMARPGHELIVGMRRDPQFGPLVMCGLGGIYVELIGDVSFRVAPFGRDQALAMIGETRAGRLLAGLRGRPPADMEAVAQVIMTLAQLALDFPQIQEIDVNPLLVYEASQGVMAVDVRMVVGA